MTLDWRTADPDAWMRHVLAIHFHPESGSPYWLERQRRLGVDVLGHVRRLADLVRLGPMPEDDLARRPLADFLPRTLLDRRAEWVVVETGGSTGRPKTTVYLEHELRSVFVDPFTAVARANGFPEGGSWLFAGPTGPHVIGRAARENARALGAADPFTIDFDPRWAKKLVPGSLGQRRYLEHVVEQCLRLLRRQQIDVLFATPRVLLELAERLERPSREGVRGVFYGGMAVAPDDYRRLRDEAFPRAIHLAGYGNTLFGLALQERPAEGGDFDYYYPGARLAVRFVERGDRGAPSPERLERRVAEGETGQLVLSRLDESFLVVNLFERDEAERLPAPPAGGPFPRATPGIRNPRPLSRSARPAAAGFY